MKNMAFMKADNWPDFEQDPVGTSEDVGRLLIKADQTLVHGRRNAGVISIALRRIVKDNPSFTYRTLELRYRSMQSLTHLIARPSAQADKHFYIRSHANVPMPFFLWIGVNGFDPEVIAILQSLEGQKTLDDQVRQNLENLTQVGFLMLPSR